MLLFIFVEITKLKMKTHSNFVNLWIHSANQKTFPVLLVCYGKHYPSVHSLIFHLPFFASWSSFTTTNTHRCILCIVRMSCAHSSFMCACHQRQIEPSRTIRMGQKWERARWRYLRWQIQTRIQRVLWSERLVNVFSTGWLMTVYYVATMALSATHLPPYLFLYVLVFVQLKMTEYVWRSECNAANEQ